MLNIAGIVLVPILIMLDVPRSCASESLGNQNNGRNGIGRRHLPVCFEDDGGCQETEEMTAGYRYLSSI